MKTYTITHYVRDPLSWNEDSRDVSAELIVCAHSEQEARKIAAESINAELSYYGLSLIGPDVIDAVYESHPKPAIKIPAQPGVIWEYIHLV